MPILHIRPDTSGVDPQGNPIQVPPPFALVRRGPCLQVTISVHPSISGPIIQQGGVVPPPVSGLALIDTGATSTSIDDAVAQTLGLPVIDVVTIGSASHAATQQNVYPALITIAGTPISVTADRAIGGPLSALGYVALIGRDVLASMTLFYNGITGEFTLSF